MTLERDRDKEKILLRLYAMHNVLFTLTSHSSIISYLQRLFQTIPGVAANEVCLIDFDDKSQNFNSVFMGSLTLKDGLIDQVEFEDLCYSLKNQNCEVYPIKTSQDFYGFVVIKLNDRRAFQFYDAVVNTFAISVSFIIENNLQKQQLEKNNLMLSIQKQALTEVVSEKTASLREAMKQLETYTEELKRSNLELIQFAYTVSHDLQEPLRTISSYLQLLERKYHQQLSADAKELMQFAVEGASRMEQMIKGILAYSRVNTRAHPFTSVDCNEIVARVLANLEFQIQKKGAKIVYSSLPVINADANQIQSVFQNLISNAIKFCVNVPLIKINCLSQENEWLFSIEDNGIGIKKVEHTYIFNLFKRLHPLGTYPGTGLGLAICKKIVERHQGKIWLESQEGKGSTFFFTISKYLPLQKENNSSDETLNS